MSYEIQIGDTKYIGQIQPGSTDIRVYNSSSTKYIATFTPRTNSENKVKSGSWKIGSFFAGLDAINRLEPELIKFCEQRRRQGHKQISQSN